MLKDKIKEGYGLIVDFADVEDVFYFIEKHRDFIEKELKKSIHHGGIVYLFDRYRHNPLGFINAINEYGYQPYYKKQIENDVAGLVAEIMHYLTGCNFVTALKEDGNFDTTQRVIYCPEINKKDTPRVKPILEDAAIMLKSNLEQIGYIKGMTL